MRVNSLQSAPFATASAASNAEASAAAGYEGARTVSNCRAITKFERSPEVSIFTTPRLAIGDQKSISTLSTSKF